ncbi:hypothetical protein [Wolbachia endosymbiont (group A) of Beris morrisii]|uniref:hypothetical protein n=1 Tax=Wolbachia endosymbiont (group A) of Beris morrisii TaxID=3066139 RepID=UPI003340AED3
MRTPKKIWKDIAEKLRNKKGTTTAKGADMEMPADVEEVKVEIKKQTNTVDKATETDTKLCNINSEDLKIPQPTCESSEKAQIETTVEPTSEPCFDSRSGNDVDEKNKPLTQQRQAILASVVGAVLLVNCVALYIMKMPVVAAIVGIVGLAYIGLALYNIINPNTKLEKVESVEQPIQSSLNLT